MLAPKGPVGTAQKTILLDSLGIMLTVVASKITGTLAMAWWSRASNRRAPYLPEFDYSGLIDLVVWAVPTMVVILLGDNVNNALAVAFGVFAIVLLGADSLWIMANLNDNMMPIESTTDLHAQR